MTHIKTLSKITKKQIILDLFHSIDWEPHHGGRRIKIITGGQFSDVGLYGDI